MKTGILIQARMSSTRFPGKSLQDLHGKPLIARVVERAKLCREAGQTVVVTSEDASDDVLCAALKKENIPYFRGSLQDVLARHYYAAKDLGLDVMVRITGDCPLIDARHVGALVRRQEKGGYDGVFSAQSVPDGFRAHVVRFSALENAFKNARLPEEREHVVPYLWNHPAHFKLFYEESSSAFPDRHLSVDRPEDLDLARKLYERLYAANPAFSMEDVFGALEKTEVSG
jgi:spore coat polysaccharide biosynthesis protein SpsF (cytidylyltransferase family)